MDQSRHNSPQGKEYLIVLDNWIIYEIKYQISHALIID